MMKTLLALILVAVVASGAAANPYLNTYNGTLGLFFDDFTGRLPEPTWDGVTFNTNSDVLTTSGFNGPFAWAYLVLMDPKVDSFHTLEFGIYCGGAEWIQGWTEVTLFGPQPNYIANALEAGGDYSALLTWPEGEGFPVNTGGATALARFKLRNWEGGEPVNVQLGPMWHLTPPTVPGRFIIIRGNDRIPVSPAVDYLEVDTEGKATVATFFGGGVVAAENHSLSNVKALFR